MACPVKPVRLQLYQQSLCAIVLPKLCEFRLLDSHVFEVVALNQRMPLKISQGGLIHLAEFRMKPETSNASWVGKEYITIGLQHPDLISPLPPFPDGVRTMNYGQWRSLENLRNWGKIQSTHPWMSIIEVWLKTSFIFTKLSLTEPAD